MRATSEYSLVLSLKLDIFAFSKARFLYFNFVLGGANFTFRDELISQILPHEASFGRLSLVENLKEFSAEDAKFVADGMNQDPAFRTIVMALISEHTRTSRQLLSLKANKPLDIGPFFKIFSALKPSKEELKLFEAISETTIRGETINATLKCQVGECDKWATWLVVCPQRDGQEYLCQDHKTHDDVSFETYRLIFSDTCGHAADRRDCGYYLVANASKRS